MRKKKTGKTSSSRNAVSYPTSSCLLQLVWEATPCRAWETTHCFKRGKPASQCGRGSLLLSNNKGDTSEHGSQNMLDLHQHLIAEPRNNSLQFRIGPCPIPMTTAMKRPEAKAVVDNESYLANSNGPLPPETLRVGITSTETQKSRRVLRRCPVCTRGRTRSA